MATKYLDAIGKTKKKKKKKKTFLEFIEDPQGALKKLININPSGLLKAVPERQRRMDDVMRQIKKAEKEDKGVIDLDTLRNHLKKIPQTGSGKAFYQHIKILRDKRWIRGHQYVADAVELEVPYGETFEGVGEVWKKKKKRYK